jgi:lysophospholipase L1-like esterase
VYRHTGVKLTREGKWTIRPKQPSLWIRQEDGVFGLGGVRVTPATAESRATVELASGAVQAGARWDLAYRVRSSRDSFSVAIKGGETLQAGGASAEPGKVQHLEWRTPKDGAMTLALVSGEPEIFGVVIEDSEPGVVIDTLGINGARMGTPLAWEAGPWVEEARRRAPVLAVLAFGTNEVGDQVAPFRYAADLEGLVARVRLAAPDADCLVMGPTDRAGVEWTSLPRVREIEAVQRGVAERAGCAFWSAAEAMGGDGGFRRWADQSPPLAAPDRVHLTPRGYATLGAALATSLLGEPIAPEAP